MKFNVGDRVKCIDTSPHVENRRNRLSGDSVYVVEQVSSSSLLIAGTWWRKARFIRAESNVKDYED